MKQSTRCVTSMRRNGTNSSSTWTPKERQELTELLEYKEDTAGGFHDVQPGDRDA